MMELKKEFRLLEYAGRECWVLYHYYVCTTTGEETTDETLDAINQAQVHEQMHKMARASEMGKHSPK